MILGRPGAGRVVFVSGVTLGLTNAGLTFCSVDVVAATCIGFGGACACLVVVTVHLTLLPVLLVICGPCCRTFAHVRCTRNNCRRCSIGRFCPVLALVPINPHHNLIFRRCF